MSRQIEALHKTGISATMASVICGVNPWDSPYSLYQRFKGEVPPKEETFQMWLGKQMEPIVIRAFTKATGLKVKRPRRVVDPAFTFRSEEYGFPMIALLDGTTTDDDGDAVVEAKTASAFASADWADEVPLWYWFQNQHQLATTGWGRAYTCAIVGNQFLYHTIERDDEVIALITDRERDFWLNHLVPGVPPAIDGHSATTAAIRDRWRRSEPGTVVIIEDPEVERLCAVSLSQKESIDRLEGEREGTINALKDLVGSHERAEVGPYRITFKEQKGRARLDTKALRAAHPKLAEEFTVTGEPTRPLTVSRKKDA